MSKRITLTDFEIQQLIAGLTHLRQETNLPYAVVNVGKRFYEGLIDKLKTEPSSQKAPSSSVNPTISEDATNDPK